MAKLGDDSDEPFVETESIIAATRRLLEGRGEERRRAGESVWDLSVDRATARVLVEQCHIHEVAWHVFDTNDDEDGRLEELCVGILANLSAHERRWGGASAVVVEAVFAASYDPPTLAECLRFFAAQGYVACTPDLTAKVLFVVHNGLDAPLVAKAFAFVVGAGLVRRRPRRHDDDDEGEGLSFGGFGAAVSDLVLAAARLLEDRAEELSLADLRAFCKDPATGLAAVLRFLQLAAADDNSGSRLWTTSASGGARVLALCTAIRDGPVWAHAHREEAAAVVELLQGIVERH